MLTPEAFNALLKTLEEPPPHVIFVLATTEPHKIPDTVLSRCQRFDFRRIPTYKIVERLAYILEQEERGAEPAALEMIARSAEGCMRDAISLTDQLLSYGGDVITEGQVQAVRGTISGQAIVELVDYLVAGDAAGGLMLINQMASEGIDLRQLAIQLVSYLRSVLLTSVGGSQAGEILTDLSREQLALVQTQAERLDSASIAHAVRLLNRAGGDMRSAAQPQLVLELAWLDALQPSPQAPEAVAAPAPVTGRPQIAASPPPMAVRETSFTPATLPAQKPENQESDLPSPSKPVPDAQVVEVLRANWTEFLQATEKACGASLRGSLRTLRNVVASGNDIYFAFEHDFAKTMLERPANKAAVQDLLAGLLGRPVRLHCQVGQQVTGVAEARASEPDAAPVASKGHDSRDLSEDPVVAHARKNLGAVPSQISSS